MRLEDKLYATKFKSDDTSHLAIKDPAACLRCVKKPCTYVCPAKCYSLQDGQVVVAYEGCLECGSCRILCSELGDLDWNYPRGGFGVVYRYG